MTNSESGKVTVEEQVERLQAEIGKCCSHGGQKISGKFWMSERKDLQGWQLMALIEYSLMID